MPIAGLRTTEAFNNPTGRRPENWREMILMLYPNGAAQSAPLTALTSVMKSEATTDPKFHWFEKRLDSRRFLLGAALAGTASGAPVAGAVQNITLDPSTTALTLAAGDLLLVEQTAEILQVATTPTSPTVVSVIRGFTAVSGSTLTAVNNTAAGTNPMLQMIGSAFEEGSSAPDPISFDPTEYNNQCQIFRRNWALSGTAQNVKTRTGDEVREAKRECLEYFTVDMERAFFFGQKTTTTRNGRVLRTTQGLLNFVPASRQFVVPGGNLSLTWFENVMVTIFRYGSTEKMAFCGLTFIQAINQMIRKNFDGRFDISPPQKEYGMDVRRLTTPAGTLVLKAHPLFTQQLGGVNNGTAYTSMDNNAVIVDMDRIKYRYVQGRDVKYWADQQLPGEDDMLAGYMGECGLELHHAETHAFIQGAIQGVQG